MTEEEHDMYNRRPLATKSIHVSEEIHESLKRIGFLSNKLLQNVIREACEDYIEKNKELLDSAYLNFRKTSK